MIPSAHPSFSSEPFHEVQALRDLFARSVTFRNAVLAEPVLGPAGAVILDVRCDQQTTFRVVAPTATEAYALLGELIAPLVHPTRQMDGTPAMPSAQVTDREGPLPQDSPYCLEGQRDAEPASTRHARALRVGLNPARRTFAIEMNTDRGRRSP